MLFNFNNEERNCLYVALIKAQGNIIEQLKSPNLNSRNYPLKKKLAKEYDDLERMARIIQRSFE